MINEAFRHTTVLAAAQTDPEADPVACETFLTAIQNGSVMQTLVNGYLDPFRLSSPGFSILLLLGVEEAVIRRPSELARILGVSRATVTGLLDTLERAGLTGRAIDPEDRRSMLVESTPACRERVRALLPGYLRLLASITDTLTPDECADFVRISRKLQDGLASVSKNTPADS